MERSRANRDLVVIGASAGGVEVLRRLVAGLPADLPASVCVVLHLAPTSPGMLAHILRRAGSLPCHTAEDGEALVPGQILVAPPDRHLTIEDDHVRLTLGPRENGHRPSVDNLFRSAARAREGRVVGVILSGARDDGALGLALIKSCGGAAIVQDPSDAPHAGMPTSALAVVQADVVTSSALIAEAIAELVRQDPAARGRCDPDDDPPAAGATPAEATS